MQSDLHKIIVSPQPLSSDHVKVFLYQILRGEFFWSVLSVVLEDYVTELQGSRMLHCIKFSSGKIS